MAFTTRRIRLDVEDPILKTTHIGDDLDSLVKPPGVPPLVTFLHTALGSLMNGLKQFISKYQVELLRRLITPNSISAFVNKAALNVLAPPVKQHMTTFVESRCGTDMEMLRRGEWSRERIVTHNTSVAQVLRGSWDLESKVISRLSIG